jgi:deazaflavin-dependent oxidoreductase (nitroreductase family)
VTTADEQRLIAEFRATGGRASGVLAGTPLLLLHHVGARTGTPRVTPLAYSCHRGDRVVVIASNGGAETHPAWLHNVRAHPEVAVEVGTDRVAVRATEPDGRERDALWAEVVERFPDVGRFQARTRRTIPLVVLQPR